VARPLDETDWRTRATAPLVLVRYARTRTTARAKRLLAVAACRLVAQHLRRDDVRRDLDRAERDVDPSPDALSAATTAILRTHRQYGDDVSRSVAAARAVASACAANVTAGLLSTFEWVLLAGRDDPALPAALCDLVREVVGNPFRPWRVQPPWLAPGGRLTPDGTTVAVPESALALARLAEERGDFGLLPVLADELEAAGWADADLLAHLRHGPNHVRGCWALDVVLGRG
jgi:hypothetical protein